MYPKRPAFGCPLEDHLRYSGRSIATVIEVCCCALHRKGIEEEGIFRMSGSGSKLKRLKAAFDAGEIDIIDCVHDPHPIACALKSYLRDLPDPIMTHNLYNKWIQAMEKEPKERIPALKEVLQQLPHSNYVNLEYLIRFLAKVTEHQHSNKMTTTNLGIIMAPSMLGVRTSADTAYLFRFFAKVTEYQYANKMTPSNLGIVMAPNMIWSPTVESSTFSSTTAHSYLIEFMVTNAQVLFPGDARFYTDLISGYYTYLEEQTTASTNAVPTPASVSNGPDLTARSKSPGTNRAAPAPPKGRPKNPAPPPPGKQLGGLSSIVAVAPIVSIGQLLQDGTDEDEDLGSTTQTQSTTKRVPPGAPGPPGQQSPSNLSSTKSGQAQQDSISAQVESSPPPPDASPYSQLTKELAQMSAAAEISPERESSTSSPLYASIPEFEAIDEDGVPVMTSSISTGAGASQSGHRKTLSLTNPPSTSPRPSGGTDVSTQPRPSYPPPPVMSRSLESVGESESDPSVSETVIAGKRDSVTLSETGSLGRSGAGGKDQASSGPLRPPLPSKESLQRNSISRQSIGKDGASASAQSTADASRNTLPIAKPRKAKEKGADVQSGNKDKTAGGAPVLNIAVGNGSDNSSKLALRQNSEGSGGDLAVNTLIQSNVVANRRSMFEGGGNNPPARPRPPVPQKPGKSTPEDPSGATRL